MIPTTVVRSRGWVAVTKKKVNLILDLQEGDFWCNKCKRGKTAKFQEVLFGFSDQS
jgi:hypothetical protein